MQIGFVEKREMIVGKDENDQPKKVTWFEMVIKAPGIRPFNLKMAKGKPSTDGKKVPDWNLYFRANEKKGEEYRDLQAGSLWLGETKDKKIPYLGGHIESPAVQGGKIYIKLFKPEPKFEGEKITWLYDVLWFSDSQNTNNNTNNNTQNYTDYSPQQGYNVEVYDANGGLVIDVNDDEIPF